MNRRLSISLMTSLLFVSFFTTAAVPRAASQEANPDGAKGFGMAVGPSRIRLQGQSGVPQTATVNLWNNGARPIDVRAALSDVANSADKNGKFERNFLPPGTVPYSCAKWVVLEQTEFTINPGERKDVNLTVSTPREMTGGSACVAFFQGTPRVDPAPQDPTKPVTQVVVQPRLGVLIFFEDTATVRREGKLTEVTLEPPREDAPLVLRYQFSNTGNADILLSGTFHILDEGKLMAGKGDLQPLRTFPGDQGAAETSWSGSLAPGKYQLVATFELGPDAQEVIVKEIAFTAG